LHSIFTSPKVWITFNYNLQQIPFWKKAKGTPHRQEQVKITASRCSSPAHQATSFGKFMNLSNTQFYHLENYSETRSLVFNLCSAELSRIQIGDLKPHMGRRNCALISFSYWSLSKDFWSLKRVKISGKNHVWGFFWFSSSVIHIFILNAVIS
jgi:hypothetical protein